MTERKPVTNSAELFRRVARLGAEEERTTEELRRELIEEGIDPVRVLSNAEAKLEQLRRDHPVKMSIGGKSDVSGEQQSQQSPLAELHERTKLPATKIADQMGVTVPFLAAVGRNPKVVPISWRKELDARAARELDVPSGVLTNAFEQPYQMPMAAMRDTQYESEDVTIESILDQSGMDEAAKDYWRTLATEE